MSTHPIERPEPDGPGRPRLRPVPAAGACTAATLAEQAADVERERARAERTDDPRATERQHARGKLTARERVALLLDPGTFTELGTFRRHEASGFGLERQRPYTDGVVTGWGLVHGRKVFVYAHDFRIFGGALGAAQAAKIQRVQDLALSVGAPIVGLNDGAGARIQEGVAALDGYAGIFRRNVQSSGTIPQVSVILGPCAGGAAYSPALTDFVFMVDGTSHMFLTGPDVVAAVTSERVTQEELGGSAVHGARSGVASFVAATEEACLADVRYLLSLLPANHGEPPPAYEPDDDPGRRCDRLLDVVPTDPRRPYDIRAVAREIVDDGELMEVHERWATNVVCALARLDGHVVGIVGNQPLSKAGVLDIDASEKAARFVRTCDTFNIPLVTLVDVPGFLPGVDQEHAGVIRVGAKLLYAYCEATVPRVQVVLRKAYGGAYIVMDSLGTGSDLSFAWPTNEIAVMGASGAASVVHRRELAAAHDPERLREELAAAYAAELMHPYNAAERGFVDEIIDPRDTRRVLVEGLRMLRTKDRPVPARRHGNPPM
ncbi:putative acyl-CoA carboxylase (Putative Propionyl-CoA carboxylase) [Nostocoides japonicum T1-X7]|uniref:Putative acyl-CoA carboxylase (Putative Propionyl-CoA carboxylase) n=1 Tax=Nostocoides japonicum T1-X7 TaxID=1194083 RepID=A0A077M319_9MICO|nr:acyl-CoA carboxylase subunit beta [Tetrasphaera japonica]CCH78589.1 putative acyl-CoA carboxylase (Putative Propionyl-CoA carboxylase) [Tetrasphaera japonica T1-X7]